MTVPLSPAAQAVLDAYETADCDPYKIDPRQAGLAAAALREAADQVVPEHANSVGDEHDDARHDQWMRIRYKFHAIAADKSQRHHALQAQNHHVCHCCRVRFHRPI